MHQNDVIANRVADLARLPLQELLRVLWPSQETATRRNPCLFNHFRALLPAALVRPMVTAGEIEPARLFLWLS